MAIATKRLKAKDTGEIDKSKTSIVRDGEVQTTRRQTNGRAVAEQTWNVKQVNGVNWCQRGCPCKGEREKERNGNGSISPLSPEFQDIRKEPFALCIISNGSKQP